VSPYWRPQPSNKECTMLSDIGLFISIMGAIALLAVPLAALSDWTTRRIYGGGQ